MALSGSHEQERQRLKRPRSKTSQFHAETAPSAVNRLCPCQAPPAPAVHAAGAASPGTAAAT